jgi:hypothetical protein
MPDKVLSINAAAARFDIFVASQALEKIILYLIMPGTKSPVETQSRRPLHARRFRRIK